jgi:hypothetical protein
MGAVNLLPGGVVLEADALQVGAEIKHLHENALSGLRERADVGSSVCLTGPRGAVSAKEGGGCFLVE